MKTILEYIWLDGYSPEPNLRSKVRIEDLNGHPQVEKLPLWSFDGSSTLQAEGKSSDCILKPVSVYSDPIRETFLESYLVLCEVLNPDGTPHQSNTRSVLEENSDLWFGFEQEYVLSKKGKPLGFPETGYPEPQGKYYCSVGYPWSAGREIAEEHMNACLGAGIDITGTNAEVLLGQWEYQILGKGSKKSADDLWISRFILQKIGEIHGVQIDLRPKPLTEGDWNGSGMHTNFSNQRMRNSGGEEYFLSICDEFGKYHDESISKYGSGNHLRLTGKHETQSIDSFSYGVSDRGASIRIPVGVIEKGWKGYMEDRRPGSNADPYLVVSVISKVLSNVGQ